jgi:hypothetical protein
MAAEKKDARGYLFAERLTADCEKGYWIWI